MSLKHGAATPEGIYDLKLMNTAKAGDPHSAMPIAARAANIVERNADRRVWVTSLYGQIEINDRTASVTRDDEPVMLRRERGGDRHHQSLAGRWMR